jgi:hypothetical protein
MMSNAYVDYGTQGAFRATWRKAQPRLLLERLIRDNPKATEEQIHSLFWQEIEDDGDTLRACVEYWLDNNYASILRFKSQPLGSAPSAALAGTKEREQVRQKIEHRIKHEASLVLLDLIMPNDKPLGDCTGNECLQFGRWFANLAKQVPPTKIVRDVLSEREASRLGSRRRNKCAAASFAATKSHANGRGRARSYVETNSSEKHDIASAEGGTNVDIQIQSISPS